MSKFKEKKESWQIFDEQEKKLARKYPSNFRELSETYYGYLNNPHNDTFRSLIQSFKDVFSQKKTKRFSKKQVEAYWDLYIKKGDIKSYITDKKEFYSYLKELLLVKGSNPTERLPNFEKTGSFNPLNIRVAKT